MSLSLPASPRFTSMVWGLSANTQLFPLPLLDSELTSKLTGARWFAQWTSPRMKLTEAGPWMALLARLEGRNGRLLISPPNSNRGAGGGSPIVDGASQTGNTLATTGWPISTAILLKGDFIRLANGELKILTDDATSDGSGDATLAIAPQIRSSPADSSAITEGGQVTMMLKDDDSGRWSRDHRGLYLFDFSAIEAF